MIGTNTIDTLPKAVLIARHMLGNKPSGVMRGFSLICLLIMARKNPKYSSVVKSILHGFIRIQHTPMQILR